MKALLFPGQGSQVVGMCAEFYKKFEVVKKIFNRADNKLGYSISKIILEGPGDQLQLTKNTQPAILTVSYSIYEVLKKYRTILTEKDNLLIYYAGHGIVEPSTKEGHWQPIGSEKDGEHSWFSDSVLKTQIRGFRAKHVIVIADACFSGSLFKDWS